MFRRKKNYFYAPWSNGLFYPCYLVCLMSSSLKWHQSWSPCDFDFNPGTLDDHTWPKRQNFRNEGLCVCVLFFFFLHIHSSVWIQTKSYCFLDEVQCTMVTTDFDLCKDTHFFRQTAINCLEYDLLLYVVFLVCLPRFVLRLALFCWSPWLI